MAFDPIEVANLFPDLLHLLSQIVRARKAKSPGGKKLTFVEKQEIRNALEELLEEAVKNAKD